MFWCRWRISPFETNNNTRSRVIQGSYFIYLFWFKVLIYKISATSLSLSLCAFLSFLHFLLVKIGLEFGCVYFMWKTYTKNILHLTWCLGGSENTFDRKIEGGSVNCFTLLFYFQPFYTLRERERERERENYLPDYTYFSITIYVQTKYWKSFSSVFPKHNQTTENIFFSKKYFHLKKFILEKHFTSGQT